ARVEDLPVAEPALAAGHQQLVPRARRVADPERAQRLLGEAAVGQVPARGRCLLRLPQVALVEAGRALQQLQQPLARLAALGRARVLVLDGQLDADALGQRLHRADEVQALGLLDELERVAPDPAAEAVVDALVSIHAERRRALLVERAQAL